MSIKDYVFGEPRRLSAWLPILVALVGVVALVSVANTCSSSATGDEIVTKRQYIVEKMEPDTAAKARALGCSEVVVGIPPALVGKVDPRSLPTVYESTITITSSPKSDVEVLQERVGGLEARVVALEAELKRIKDAVSAPEKTK